MRQRLGQDNPEVLDEGGLIVVQRHDVPDVS
jgi:hypothetical protein